MEQIYIDKIKKEYEDIKGMVESNFAEEDDDSISLGRYKKIQRVEDAYLRWMMDERPQNIEDWIVSYIVEEIIDYSKDNVEIKETNGILSYINEAPYEKYQKLFGKRIADVPDPEEIYILYIDIETKQKYFVKKSNRKEFEESHNIIVPYQSAWCDPDVDFERNYTTVFLKRNEFIKEAIYSNQEIATKRVLERYPNQSTDMYEIKEAKRKRVRELYKKNGISYEE